MATKRKLLQQLFPLYRQETGETELDMHKVAGWAMKRGVKAPTPKTAVELLAKQLSIAAREEYRSDPETGWAYRANHAYKRSGPNGTQLTLWVELDTATRPQMHMSVTNRRDQMIGDAMQLRIDTTVWNNRNPEEEPIQLVLDFSEDVAERLSSPQYLNESESEPIPA